MLIQSGRSLPSPPRDVFTCTYGCSWEGEALNQRVTSHIVLSRMLAIKVTASMGDAVVVI
jgi:hypothetical protein